MPLSSVSYTGNGSLKLYTVPFEYVDRSHVKAYLNGSLTTNYSWSTSSVIQFTTAPASGVAILIRRETPTTRLVEFSDTSTLTAADLNKDADQAAFLAEEHEDRLDDIDTLNTTQNSRLTTAEGNITSLQSGKANTVHTHVSTDITDSTTTGRAVLTAASQSAARTAMGLGTASTQATGAFAAAVHVHVIGDVTGLQTALDGKAAAAHTHVSADITDLLATIDSRVGTLSSGVVSFNGRLGVVVPQSGDYGVADITGLQPALDGKASVSHAHSIANVTGLQTALDGKAATSHTHTISDITGLQTALDGKAATSHTHSIANVTGLQTALDAKQASLPAGTNGQLLTLSSGSPAWTDVPVRGGVPDVIIENQTASGTHGGGASSGWNARDLNTTIRNAGSIATVSSGQFTIGAGTYYIEWDSIANRVDGTQSRLYNVTDANTVGLGLSFTTVNASGNACINSTGSAVVTLTGNKTFRLDQYCTTSHANTGLGVSSGAGTSNVYARVKIWKLV